MVDLYYWHFVDRGQECSQVSCTKYRIAHKEDEVPTSARMANKAKAALQLIPAVLYLLKLEGIHCTGCDQRVPAVTALGLKWLQSSTPASSLTFRLHMGFPKAQEADREAVRFNSWLTEETYFYSTLE